MNTPGTVSLTYSELISLMSDQNFTNEEIYYVVNKWLNEK